MDGPRAPRVCRVVLWWGGALPKPLIFSVPKRLPKKRVREQQQGIAFCRDWLMKV